ncbi:DUF2235 domain-containing protein [Alkalicaulis satelles]|uniref:DUF2235 domain-containing protein n=1 Tax=Alkalicaulis satelles TaxID=2609175 RepID=A0A5M6ZER6_9PROT|nr:DUF2235 domain-containing protein [Alkalicaulis satelles]KAA5802364.1 DUF2235 domain-containing protein [Alkalicaulis satelles]
MQRLVVCCDGSWQHPGQETPSNVARLAQAVLPGDSIRQLVYYDSGVGSPHIAAPPRWSERVSETVQNCLGGVFGAGLEAKICNAYLFLVLNHRPGDEIYLFGYSRGAYTARSLAGLIYCSGLLRRDAMTRAREAWALYQGPDKPGSSAAKTFRESYAPRPYVTFLGCWDTVGMRGIPNITGVNAINQIVNRAHAFHDMVVNREIGAVRHACAIDEPRRALPLTDMEPHPASAPGQIKQAWFPGPHGAVGGGEKRHEALSGLALDWMAGEAQARGLQLDWSRLNRGEPRNALADYHVGFGLLSLLGRQARTLHLKGAFGFHRGVRARWAGRPYYRETRTALHHFASQERWRDFPAPQTRA